MVLKIHEMIYSVLKVQRTFRRKENPVTIAGRLHLFPSRTQKLSSLAPMILGGKLPGKVGRCRFFSFFVNRQRLYFPKVRFSMMVSASPQGRKAWNSACLVIWTLPVFYYFNFRDRDKKLSTAARHVLLFSFFVFIKKKAGRIGKKTGSDWTPVSSRFSYWRNPL